MKTLLLVLLACVAVGCGDRTPLVPTVDPQPVAPVAFELHDMTTRAFVAGHLTLQTDAAIFDVDLPAAPQLLKLPVDRPVALHITAAGYAPIDVVHTLHAGGIWTFDLHH